MTTQDNNLVEPPPYTENGNVKNPKPLSNIVSLNEERTRFTIYSLIFLFITTMNLVALIYWNSSDQTLSHKHSCPNMSTNCTWIGFKIVGYSFGLIAVLFSLFINTSVHVFNIINSNNKKIINIISGVMLIISSILVCIGQSLMILKGEIGDIVFCGNRGDYDDEGWNFSSSMTNTCCWCDRAAFITSYVLLSIFIGIDMITKKGNNPTARLLFYFITYMLISIFLIRFYFDADFFESFSNFRQILVYLCQTGTIIIMVLSVIMFGLLLMPLTIPPTLFKVVAILFLIFVLPFITLLDLERWIDYSSYFSCDIYMYEIFGFVVVFELVMYPSNCIKFKSV